MKLAGHVVIEIAIQQGEEGYFYNGAVKVTDAETNEYILSQDKSSNFDNKPEALEQLREMFVELVNYALEDTQG